MCVQCVYVGERSRVGTVSPSQRRSCGPQVPRYGTGVLIISLILVTLDGYLTCVSASPSGKMSVTITSIP